jgi:hypothetical protein
MKLESESQIQTQVQIVTASSITSLSNARLIGASAYVRPKQNSFESHSRVMWTLLWSIR